MPRALTLDKITTLSASPQVNTRNNLTGLAIAGVIIAIWGISLAMLLNWHAAKQTPSLIVLAIFWQAFLYTGLFITAHDAMHGAILPKFPKINHLIGTFALLIYGLFSYQQLFKAHWQHHHHPASDLDPDFHDGKHKNGFAWYFHFVKSYWSWWRLLGLIVIFHLLHSLLHVSEFNLRWFWIAPSLISSVQLFYFGTYLPHREPIAGYQNDFRTQSNYRPLLWSFLTCYHFGYHKEHHEFPQVPWWQLPTLVTSKKKYD